MQVRRATAVGPARSGADNRVRERRTIDALSSSIQPFIQIPKDTRGRAPDVAAAELHDVKAEGESVPVATFALVVLGRHQESERHLESVIGLVAVQPKRKAGPHAREHGHDAIAERSHVNVKIADRFDKAAAKRDLLLGLAQRGRGRAFVTGINLSAGERNLSRVVGKMCSAPNPSAPP